MATLTLSTLGADVVITGASSVIDVLREVFVDTVVSTATPRSSRANDVIDVRIRRRGIGTWRLTVGDETLIDRAELADVVPELLTGLNRALAHRRAASDIVLHGGAFDVRGSAVIVCGPSGAGKSTLVAAAVRAGFGYIADELSAIDRHTFGVAAYHRPIGLRPEGARRVGVDPPPERLVFDGVWPTAASRLGTLAGATPVAHVVIVEFDRDAEQAPVEHLGSAHALTELVDLTLGSDGRQLEVFRRLEGMVRSIPVSVIRFSDSIDAVRHLSELVDGRA